MTPDEEFLLAGTMAHFKEIARQNRFAENGTIEHTGSTCLVCHPELVPLDPFVVYFDIVAEAVKVRRPRLDRELAAEINGDLELQGESIRVTLEDLAEGEEKAVRSWLAWIKDALSTGLGLLSVHSRTSLEFDLDSPEAQRWGNLIESRSKEIMAHQLGNFRPVPSQ